MTVEPEPAVSDPEKQLAWEKRHRFRAAIASILGAVGLLVFYVLQQVLQRDIPRSAGSRRSCARPSPGDVGALPSLQTAFFEYLDTKTRARPAIGSAGSSGGSGSHGRSGFLGVATRARVPSSASPRLHADRRRRRARVSVLMSQLGSPQVVSDFLDSDRTVRAATDADNS